MFLQEAPVEAELLGLERMARQVRGGVEIVRAQAEGGAQNDLVEDGRGRVDDQVQKHLTQPCLIRVDVGNLAVGLHHSRPVANA